MAEQSRTRRKANTTARARALRQGDNMAEAMLWNELKNRKLGGYKFVRQFPVGPYYADFFCRGRRLVVELDGSQHADNAYDRARDAFMTEQGISILRFWSFEVLKELRSICETILAALDGKLEEVVARDLRYVVGRREKTSPVVESPAKAPPHRPPSISARAWLPGQRSRNTGRPPLPLPGGEEPSLARTAPLSEQIGCGEAGASPRSRRRT